MNKTTFIDNESSNNYEMFNKKYQEIRMQPVLFVTLRKSNNKTEVPLTKRLRSFSKPRRRRRQERHQTKGLMRRPMAVHVRFESWYISLPSSAKQQREMTKFYVFWRTRTAMANFWYLLLELNAVGAC